MTTTAKPRNGVLRDIWLPGWYRTTRSTQSHLWDVFGPKSVKAKCGRIAIKDGLVVPLVSKEHRCYECDDMARGAN